MRKDQFIKQWINSLSLHWTQQMVNDNCLFYASHPTDLLSKVVATQLPNQVTGSSDYLTVTGVGLDARYRTPNTADYKTADSDYVFWKTDASESTCDGNRLIGYDFPRILVKYLNVAPYTILAIAILKPGVSVTNGMRDAFDLNIWWDNTLSDHGRWKQNKPTAGQYLWTAEAVSPTGLTLTLISGGVKIDWDVDNTNHIEIWGRNDSEASTLLYDIGEGVATKNDTCDAVDLRTYKIRTVLGGGNYSDFSDEVSIVMLGAEIILYSPDIPGQFDAAAHWQCDGCWSISGGKANYDDNSAGKFLSNGTLAPPFAPTITLNKTYRVKFDISGAAVTSILAIIDTTIAGVFAAPYNTLKTFDNGSYTFYSVCTKSATGLGIYSSTAQSAYSFDNWSIKEVLVP